MMNSFSRFARRAALVKPAMNTSRFMTVAAKPRLILSPSQQQGFDSMTCMERYILRSKTPIQAKECPFATRVKSDEEIASVGDYIDRMTKSLKSKPLMNKFGQGN